MIPRLSILVVLGIALAGCASGPWPRTTRTNDRTTLEVPWVELAAPAGRRPISIFGVLHVGDAAFFAEVQDATNRCGLVFYEGVVPLPGEALSADMTRYVVAMSSMAKTLDLALQSDTVRPRSWWRRADITEDEFTRSGNLDLIATDLEREARALTYCANKDVARSEFAKGILAEPNDDTFLIRRRNAVPLRALEGAQGEGRIGLLYGAHHVPDLMQRLEHLGYQVTRIKWVPAMSYITPEVPHLRTGLNWRSW